MAISSDAMCANFKLFTTTPGHDETARLAACAHCNTVWFRYEQNSDVWTKVKNEEEIEYLKGEFQIHWA